MLICHIADDGVNVYISTKNSENENSTSEVLKNRFYLKLYTVLSYNLDMNLRLWNQSWTKLQLMWNMKQQ
jgi:hypothetical protein